MLFPVVSHRVGHFLQQLKAEFPRGRIGVGGGGREELQIRRMVLRLLLRQNGRQRRQTRADGPNGFRRQPLQDLRLPLQLIGGPERAKVSRQALAQDNGGHVPHRHGFLRVGNNLPQHIHAGRLFQDGLERGFGLADRDRVGLRQRGQPRYHLRVFRCLLLLRHDDGRMRCAVSSQFAIAAASGFGISIGERTSRDTVQAR